MSLEFSDIRYAYGKANALNGVSFSANAGEITCLLGPSGCGKSTLLRLTAGILNIQHGEIRLNGELLAGPNHSPPPEARSVGLVFQEGALFPHMSVRRNVEFGLAGNKDKRDIASSLLEVVGLTDFADRYPHTLSGGQQQRVALARALAPKPQVLLLDEPFASVDVVRRRALREETRRMLKGRNAVTIMVTHDPEEAMEIADQIAVMEDHKIVQLGAPEALYDTPKTAKVGALISEGQILPARQTSNGVETEFGIWAAEAFHGPLPGTQNLDLLVRLDSIEISAGEIGTGHTVVGGSPLVIEDIRCAGGRQRIIISSQTGARLPVETQRNAAFKIGEMVTLAPKQGAIVAYASTD